MIRKNLWLAIIVLSGNPFIRLDSAESVALVFLLRSHPEMLMSDAVGLYSSINSLSAPPWAAMSPTLISEITR